MKKLRILALLLVFAVCLGVLASCGGGSDVTNDGGERGADGSWDGVDFGGQTVNFCISVNKYDECNFPAADIYTKGPDQAGTNEVAKEVIARNAAAEETLGVKINYSEKDLTYDKILEDIRAIVQTSAKNSPDIYNNDIYGLARAMVDGLLWNVKNPGADVVSYFNFEADGFYTEFMRGCTFDQSKFYLIAGDYFIDMIRMAWIILVNNDLFAANIKKMPTWCTSVDEFYAYVEEGAWDIDMLGDLANRAFTDGAGGTGGIAEKSDLVVGLAINHVTDWVIGTSSGVTLFYQDKDNGYAPSVLSTMDTYQRLANRYAELASTAGVYFDQIVNTSTECFLQGNYLFAFSRLGEMESPTLRDFSMAKGLVPVPKWDWTEQEEYHTMVHDQAEIACVLNTAKAFSAASALMQFLNEESEQVVYTYFEKGLKYKYNDDIASRTMMDIVRASTDSPFGSQIGSLCRQLYTGTGTLKGLSLETPDTISSTFASEKDAYNDCMRRMVELFATLQ